MVIDAVDDSGGDIEVIENEGEIGEVRRGLAVINMNTLRKGEFGVLDVLSVIDSGDKFFGVESKSLQTVARGTWERDFDKEVWVIS